MAQPTGSDSRDIIIADVNHVPSSLLPQHRRRIERTLRALGAVYYDMILPETHVLPMIIHPDEQIQGVVYGKYRQATMNGVSLGRGALVATDKRVLLIDRKPIFMKNNEIIYRVVSGVTYSRMGFMGTVNLHTRLGDVSMRTFNQKCAHNFVEAIEANILTDLTP